MTGDRLLFTKSDVLPLQQVLSQPFMFGASSESETSLHSCLHVGEYGDSFDSTVYR